MTVSRRIFLRHGVWAALSAAIPLQVWPQTRVPAGDGKAASGPHDGQTRKGSADPYAALERLQRESFVSAIGSAFQAQAREDSFWLRLLAVNDLPAPPSANPGAFAVMNKKVGKTSAVQTDGFMLLFSGTSPDAAPQATYRFTHSTLGEFALFIVPEGTSPGTYNAVINRLAAAGGSFSALAAAPVEVPAPATRHKAIAQEEATSSGSESLSPRPSGTRGVQRAAGKD